MTSSTPQWRDDRAPFSAGQFSSNGYYEEFAPTELLPGEPITPPHRRSRGAVLLSSIIALSAAGGAWSLVSNPPQWLQTLSGAYEDLSASMQRGDEPAKPVAQLATATSLSDVPTVKADQTVSAVPLGPPAPDPSLLAPKDIGEAPGANAGTAIANDTKVAAGDVAADTLEEASPKPPPAAARILTDPYQKKAEAVGLNPGVSRALLKKLSKADYRNAGIAIKTALAETADSDVYTYPRDKKPGLASFEVKFVAGAEDKCRRYVVTITKDRWSTTAPPMEKCGLAAPQGTARKVSIETIPGARTQKKPRDAAGPSDVNG